MKVLIVGQFKSWAIENHYARYLRNHADVYVFPAEELFDDYYWRSNWNKIKFKIGLSDIYERIAGELIQRARELQPDVVLIFKGMRILPASIIDLKNLGVKVANYNPDHPFLFSGKGSGNKNVSQSISLYDLHLSYSREVMKRIAREYDIPTAFLPFAFELPGTLFQEIKKEKEINKACFIGNPDKIRAAHILALANSGVQIDVYGYGWHKFLPNSKNIQINTAVLKDEFWRTMRKYRLQINIFRPHNIGSHNMRTFEVPAAGSIMLAPDSLEHREFFEIGKEIFIYQNKSDLVEQAKHILSMSAEGANKIRQNARKKSLDAGYAYEDRTALLYNALSKIVPAKKATALNA